MRSYEPILYLLFIAIDVRAFGNTHDFVGSLVHGVWGGSVESSAIAYRYERNLEKMSCYFGSSGVTKRMDRSRHFWGGCMSRRAESAGKKERKWSKIILYDRIPAMVIISHHIDKDDCARTRISNSGIEAEIK
jgi:hypothetical protein